MNNVVWHNSDYISNATESFGDALYDVLFHCVNLDTAVRHMSGIHILCETVIDGEKERNWFSLKTVIDKMLKEPILDYISKSTNTTLDMREDDVRIAFAIVSELTYSQPNILNTLGDILAEEIITNDRYKYANIPQDFMKAVERCSAECKAITL